MSRKKKHHTVMIPLYKKLDRVPECKLERKFKDRSTEAVNKDMFESSYTKLIANQSRQYQTQVR
jgi:hypothetical protein